MNRLTFRGAGIARANFRTTPGPAARKGTPHAPPPVLASRSARSAAAVPVAATLALAGCQIETSGSGLSSSGSASAGGSSSGGSSASGTGSTSVPSGPSRGRGADHRAERGFLGRLQPDRPGQEQHRPDHVRAVRHHGREATSGPRPSAGWTSGSSWTARRRAPTTRPTTTCTSHSVKVVWSSSKFEYTHQKTLVVDRSEAVIMTANLTSQYYATSRDFLVTDTSRPDVDAIGAVFDADLRSPQRHPRRRPGPGVVADRFPGQAARADQRRPPQPAHLQRGDGRQHDREGAHRRGQARGRRPGHRGEHRR